LLLNARATIANVPPAVASLAGVRPVMRVQGGSAGLNDAMASLPDLWWNSLLCLGVIGRGAAIAIAGSLALLGAVALSRARQLARAIDEELQAGAAA
jgi:hypothetical protein